MYFLVNTVKYTFFYQFFFNYLLNDWKSHRESPVLGSVYFKVFTSIVAVAEVSRTAEINTWLYLNHPWWLRLLARQFSHSVDCCVQANGG